MGNRKRSKASKAPMDGSEQHKGALAIEETVAVRELYLSEEEAAGTPWPPLCINCARVASTHRLEFKATQYGPHGDSKTVRLWPYVCGECHDPFIPTERVEAGRAYNRLVVTGSAILLMCAAGACYVGGDHLSDSQVVPFLMIGGSVGAVLLSAAWLIRRLAIWTMSRDQRALRREVEGSLFLIFSSDHVSLYFRHAAVCKALLVRVAERRAHRM